jgi:hypothetical protein
MSRLATAFVLALLPVVSAFAAVPSPTIEGPITGPGAPAIAATGFDLAEVGYVQEEYFISGTARAFTNTAPLGNDGVWSAVPGTTAAYKTRILVYRPAKAAKFRGTALVEWLNVSFGIDTGPDWIGSHVELIRSGLVWIGVSAQFVGVEGGPPLLPGAFSLPLKTLNPVRYGTLVHPGDSFSYDIYSQAAQALRSPSGPDPLGPLRRRLKALIAIGESQSAFRMVTYANAIHPTAHVFDGFFVHSRSAGGAPLSEAPQPAIGVPSPAFIRTDLDVPVMEFQTETDLLFLGSRLARQPDDDGFRLWEVAGTSHADTYLIATGATDKGKDPAAANLVITSSPLGVFVCPQPINSGPQHFVLNAAIRAFVRWVRRGTPPPIAPRLDVVEMPSPHFQVDANGNATGGIRTPHVDAPLAILSGGGQTGGIACLLFGTTALFDAPTLQTLYPKHRVYTTAVNQSANRAMKGKFLTGQDARLLRKNASLSSVGQ